MGLVDEIERTKFRYKADVVNALIRSNRARYGMVRPQMRMVLFLMHCQITKWAIGYWFNVRKKMGLDLAAIEPDDVAFELYDIFNGCVDVFDDTKGELFYQYQKSVTRKFRKIFNSKSASEVGYGFINGGDYSEEEGMEILMNGGDTDTETGYEFDLEDVGRILSRRQMNTLEKVLTLQGNPTAKDFGASPKVYEDTLNRMTRAIDTPQRKKSMDTLIWKNREFRDIPKQDLPKDGEHVAIVVQFKERVTDIGNRRYEVLEHRDDGEEWDYFHLAVFTEFDDAVMFADVKNRSISRMR